MVRAAQPPMVKGTSTDLLCIFQDVIIAATGFETNFRPPFPIRGLNGVDLAQVRCRIICSLR